MVRAMPYRRASGEVAGRGGEREWERWPRGWIVGVFVLCVLGVTGVIGGGLTGAVMQTWLYGLLVLPLLVSAGLLGAAITGPFERAGCFGGSPWPDGYRLVVSVAMGLGVYALAMVGLGAVHLLNPPWVAGLLQFAGAAIGIAPARRWWGRFDGRFLRRGGRRGEWLVLLGAVPVAMVLIAATFPPGTLWGSEGHGYDVLEYHLQMPREYGAANAIMPVVHNVYSYLPANVEMLYLLLMQTAKFAMQDGSSLGHLWGVYPAQLLHVCLMLLTVMAAGLAPVQMGGIGRAVAMIAVLGVPWTIVTGSLAYDEWGMMLFGTLAVGMALRSPLREGTRRWDGLLLGVMLGLAVGCKLTAGIMFAVPAALVLMLRGQVREAAVAAVVASVIYAPWAVRAGIGSGGNPVFPLAATVLPRDGWTGEQAARFEHGHAALESQQSLAGRVDALAQASLLEGQWSPGWSSIYQWAGETPPAVWWKHLGILWVVLPLSVGLAFTTGGNGRRRLAAWWLLTLGVQVVGWMGLTHLQSRFLLPAVVPVAMLLGMGVEGATSGGLLSGVGRVLICAVVGGQALCAGFLLLPEAGLLGGVHALRGRPVPVPPIGELFTRAINIPAIVGAGPGESAPSVEGTVLLEGGATPLFWEGRIVYNTVFDRNLLGDALRRGGAGEGARFLRDSGVNEVVIDWTEVHRLGATYGFDDAITPKAIEELIQAGIGPAKIEAPAGWTVLQVQPVLK